MFWSQKWETTSPLFGDWALRTARDYSFTTWRLLGSRTFPTGWVVHLQLSSRNLSFLTSNLCFILRKRSLRSQSRRPGGSLDISELSLRGWKLSSIIFYRSGGMRFTVGRILSFSVWWVAEFVFSYRPSGPLLFFVATVSDSGLSSYLQSMLQ